MSALDQAFIKAYAKDQTETPALARAEAVPASFGRSGGVLAPGSTSVDQQYRDAALYRVEVPPAAPRAALATGRVPPPHLLVPPPTSPRRSARRSMLKLLAEQKAAQSNSAAQELPPRVARKVIIRHIAHRPAPPPLGLLPAEQQSKQPEAAPIRPPAIHPSRTQDELPPESIADEPAPVAPLPGGPLVPHGAPEVAPLNEAIELAPHVSVQQKWEASPSSTILLLPDASEFITASASIEAIQCQAMLPALEPVARHESAPLDPQSPADSDSFATKSLDNTDQAAAQCRIDPPHAQAGLRPHTRFSDHSQRQPDRQPDITKAAPQSPAAPAPTQPPVPITDRQPPVATAAPVLAAVVPEIESRAQDGSRAESPAAAVPAADELTWAEPLDNALAEDLIPLSEADSAAFDDQAATDPVPPPRPAIPVWEVDRFYWPKTCETLLADKHGYFAHAGEKLLAAVHDGLRVLAVTGSRRGEGRTTLSLCLARAAAAAKIQVAIMDGDFARPQLAAKIGLDISYGWQDAAIGKIPLSEAAVKSLADNITVLPLESCAAARAMSLADPRVTATIRAAAATFELLILDLGPLAGSDALAFPPGEGSPFDAAIVVRDLRYTTAAQTEVVGRLLLDAGVEAVGIAENFVDEE